MEFYYTCDEKITAWRRSTYKIEADTQEIADKMAERLFVMRRFANAESGPDILEDSIEIMDPGLNDNCATAEMKRSDEQHVVVASNGQEQITF